MAHGTPDWGVTAGAVTTYQLTDLGELAARLGSIDTFDRRGDAISLEGFESGLSKVHTFTAGTGAVVDLSLARARSGLFSARLVGGSTGVGTALLRKRVPFAAPSRVGIEVSVSLGGDVEAVEWGIVVYDGSLRRDFLVRWRDATSELVYVDDAGAEVQFATGVDLFVSATLFHAGKLVGDMSTGLYVRFLLNRTEYDLSSFKAEGTPDSTEAHIIAGPLISSRVGQNDTIYVDDVIVTQNEPA